MASCKIHSRLLCRSQRGESSLPQEQSDSGLTLQVAETISGVEKNLGLNAL